jgi:hypothetical protein
VFEDNILLPFQFLPRVFDPPSLSSFPLKDASVPPAPLPFKRTSSTATDMLRRRTDGCASQLATTTIDMQNPAAVANVTPAAPAARDVAAIA